MGLQEVKSMYQEKYGHDMDEEGKGQAYEFDKDGMLWTGTVGRGPAPALSALEGMLEEVKSLYQKKYGHDVGEEGKGQPYEFDEDGTLWIGTVGRGPAPTLSALEEKLEDVKSMYQEKYGHDMDEEA